MIIETIVGIGVATGIGVVGYVGKRVVNSVDRMDVVVRGDGNGNPGLGERIRDVHQEVRIVGDRLNVHIAECE